MTESEARDVIRQAVADARLQDARIASAVGTGCPTAWTVESFSRDGEPPHETLTVTFQAETWQSLKLEARRRGQGRWFLDEIQWIDYPEAFSRAERHGWPTPKPED